MKKVTLTEKIYSKRTINKVNKKMILLGDNSKYNTKKFLNYRMFGTILIFLILILFSKNGYILAPVCAFGYYFLITYILIDYPIEKRTLKLEHEAIFFLEILILTLESGKTLSQALEITTKNIEGDLSKEFTKTLNEGKIGRSMIESLKAMKNRIPSEAIKNVVLNMIESSLFGSNIVNSLDNQLKYLRNKELMEIKGRINKLPTKISVISVVFFIPIILLIILSPVIIDFILG